MAKKQKKKMKLRLIYQREREKQSRKVVFFFEIKFSDLHSPFSYIIVIFIISSKTGICIAFLLLFLSYIFIFLLSNSYREQNIQMKNSVTIKRGGKKIIIKNKYIFEQVHCIKYIVLVSKITFCGENVFGMIKNEF